MEVTYMDNAATSYPKPEAVYDAVDRFNRFMGGNPGRGSSRSTLEAGSVVLQTREALAKLFNIEDSSRIAFTFNITDALNIGLKGILRPGDHVITTSMEHNAVARPLYFLSQQGVEWTAVPCDPEGRLDPEDIRKAIKSNTRMICMLHASNLIGTIMPIEEVGKIARQENILFMVDSAQTAGILPIDVERAHIDLLAFTGHKGLLGPQGTGGLYVRPGLTVNPLRQGGTGSFSEYLEHPELMPDSLESGTLNTPGLAGLLAGIRFIEETGLDTIYQKEQALLEQLIEGLSSISGVALYGPSDLKQRTAVVAMNVEGMDCGELSLNLDYEFGIITRAGLHCAPLAHQTIGTFESGSCRLSPGFFTTAEDIDKVIKSVYQLAKRQ
ncbi:MAG TPA: aminotransferase class V-fold PLP-dependent enzyme [Syntrophomonadaceae bacterium]|nr:aminotransferase class V-fold PLP-dependent enzyme [Syntrophomonadaceae bacterium]HQE23819.1 aminotransferase class V-fold PLP-dependent enzyme [Syntrophomonadaceae bacterium]